MDLLDKVHDVIWAFASVVGSLGTFPLMYQDTLLTVGSENAVVAHWLLLRSWLLGARWALRFLCLAHSAHARDAIYAHETQDAVAPTT